MSFSAMMGKGLIAFENAYVAERVVHNDALQKEVAVLTEERNALQAELETI